MFCTVVGAGDGIPSKMETTALTKARGKERAKVGGAGGVIMPVLAVQCREDLMLRCEEATAVCVAARWFPSAMTLISQRRQMFG